MYAEGYACGRTEERRRDKGKVARFSSAVSISLD